MSTLNEDRMKGALAAAKKDARRYKAYLTSLSETVTLYLSKIDEEMQNHSSYQRGQRIAGLSNMLEMANDQARHFGLGLPLKKESHDERQKPTRHRL